MFWVAGLTSEAAKKLTNSGSILNRADEKAFGCSGHASPDHFDMFTPGAVYGP
jgi:hypothetical protein